MTHDIYKLAVVPYIIADRAAWNVMEDDPKFRGYEPAKMAEIAEKLNAPLCDKAATIYANNEHFRKQINDKRTDSRYCLEMFMEHWAKGMIKKLKP
jgi:imidazole glycerol phosphate synthase subunit HisF